MHDYDKLVVADLEEIITIIKKECNHSDYTEALQYSIRCVKQHDCLVAENERLSQENKQLKEALKKSRPTNGFGHCFSCGLRFDIIHENGHLKNCEYIRLIGGDGE